MPSFKHLKIEILDFASFLVGSGLGPGWVRVGSGLGPGREGKVSARVPYSTRGT